MTDEAPLSLRERTRRAVQADISATAQALFIEQGYEATTFDQIADAVGMSKRSVYRYFATKEDVVCAKYDAVADVLAAALVRRPAGEHVWTSLRAAFDEVVPSLDDESRRAGSVATEQIVQQTPALKARYLIKVEQMQRRCEAVIRERAQSRGQGYSTNDPRPRAIVGAAFACLLAAQDAFVAEGQPEPFAGLLDTAMETIATMSRIDQPDTE